MQQLANGEGIIVSAIHQPEPIRKTFNRTAWLSSLLLLASFMLAIPSCGHCAEDSVRVPKWYGLMDAYFHSECDSLRVGDIGGVTFVFPILGNVIAIESQRPLISLAHFKARRKSERLPATFLAIGAVGVLSEYVPKLFNKKWGLSDSTGVYMLIPFGMHVGISPFKKLTFLAGVVPDLFLFTDDDGLMFRYRVGFRVGPDSHTGLMLSGGYSKVRYVGFERPSRTFPGGLYAGLSIAFFTD